MNALSRITGYIFGAWLLVTASMASAAETKSLTASFDIARELFRNYNEAFVRHWKQQARESAK